MIANLPYVPLKKLSASSSGTKVKDPISFEPQDAIFAKDKGMAVIKRFLIDAKTRLSPTGTILLELDYRNGKELQEFAAKIFPAATKVALKKDLAGLNRYLIVNNKK
jgi:release factor glutamine methyltransferase